MLVCLGTPFLSVVIKSAAQEVGWWLDQRSLRNSSMVDFLNLSSIELLQVGVQIFPNGIGDIRQSFFSGGPLGPAARQAGCTNREAFLRWVEYNL
jgi:hypothetical protein